MRGYNPPPVPFAGQASNFMFTLNFAMNERGFIREVPRLLDFSLWPNWVTFCIYSLEIGESGTHHFQGYLETRGKHSFNQMHGEVNGLEHATFLVRRGTQQQAIAYCSKVDDPTFVEGPYTFGQPKEQGRRSDLAEIQQKLLEGVSFARIADENFSSYIRYGKAFREYKRIKTNPRNFKSRVVLFVGPPGRGKSTLMKLIAQRLGSVYKVPQPKGSGTYYDDYDAQDVVIFDEFDGHFMKPTDFNLICDEHECVLPVHGGAGHQLTSKYIFIGSNYAPHFWWKNRSARQLKQTTRRIEVVFKVGIDCSVCEAGLLCAHHHDVPMIYPRYGLDPVDSAPAQPISMALEEVDIELDRLFDFE